MSKFEEEAYSIIFAALKHPVRRKILRLLSKGSKSFTEMQTLSNVNSPYLTYHLESLGDLVSKMENGVYKLSSMGEGAVALMEKVEETPKIAPRRSLSSRWTRILNIFKVSSIVIAVALILIGWQLASVTTVEYLYPLPTRWTIRYGAVETVEGKVFNTYISGWVPPPEQLVINRVALLVVKGIFVSNATEGIYNITVRYLEFSPVDEKYVLAERNYSGVFLSSEIGDNYIFSGFVSVPGSIGLTESQQPIPKDIVITVRTNTTDPIESEPVRVESAMYGNRFIEKRPYQTEALLCLSGGLILLAGTSITFLSVYIYEHKHQSRNTREGLYLP